MSRSKPSAPEPQPDLGSLPTDALMPHLYERLRAVAGSYLKRERPDAILEPSALIHETYLRLAENPPTPWRGPEHFLAIAAAAMRRVLIDHARRRRALKRGFGQARVSFEVLSETGHAEFEVGELDEVLQHLAKVDPRAARGVELRFFAGLTHGQIARILGVSRKTVVADWSRSREWLARHLGESDTPIPRPRPDVHLNGYHPRTEHAEDFDTPVPKPDTLVVTRSLRRAARRAQAAEAADGRGSSRPHAQQLVTA